MVEVRFSKSKRLTGTIARIVDDTCDVDLDTGTKEKEIPLALIHNAVDSAKEDAAVLFKSEASDIKISLSSSLSIGDRVEAKFRGRGSRYYRGTIKNVSGGKYDIDYDDGDRERKLSAEHIRKLDGIVELEQKQRERVSRPNRIAINSADEEKNPAIESIVSDVKIEDSVSPKQSLFRKGHRVMARYRGRGKRWYKGTITESFDLKNEYTIHYDDGDRDRNLSAEFIRALPPEVLQEKAASAVRGSYAGNLKVVLNSEDDDAGSKENIKPATKDDNVVDVSTVAADATKIMLEEGVNVAEDSSKEYNVAAAPDDVSIIVADIADGDVSFVVDSSHKARKEESTTSSDEVSGDHTKQLDEEYTGKGNRLYRGKVKGVKTIHLYEIEYPDSTTDTNIPFGALRLPQGFNESDIKAGTTVDVLSWQDRFTAVLQLR